MLKVLLCLGRYLPGIILLSVLVACERGDPNAVVEDSSSETEVEADVLPPGIEFVALNRDSQVGNSRTGFETLSAGRTGVYASVRIKKDHDRAHLYTSAYAMGAITVGDLDGDGSPDLYLCNGPGSNRLYRQIDPFKFEDITEQARVGGSDTWSTGATLVDIDNDGDLDIYVCNYDDPNKLYVNDGAGRFTEEADRFNIQIQDASLMAAFCDYDLDGYLDLYLLKGRYHRKGGRPGSPPHEKYRGKWRIKHKYAKYFSFRGIAGETIPRVYGRRDQLFRNEVGRGRGFRDVTQKARIVGFGQGRSVTWWDFNLDGHPDIYVGNDFEDSDILYRNQGDGTFAIYSNRALPHTTWFSKGADVADVNNDGHWDFLSVDIGATTLRKEKVEIVGITKADRWLVANAQPRQYMRNALYLNTGAESFMEIAYLAGLARSNWSWSANFADLDNDGWIDLHINNGMARDVTDADFNAEFRSSLNQTGMSEWKLYQDQPGMAQANLAFRNLGDLRFDDTSEAWGLAKIGMSYGTAVADLDRDGNLDLVIANLDDSITIHRNHGSTGHAVIVQLQGVASNRFGIGATVKVKTANGEQMRLVTTMKGYHSAREPVVHFGLGDLNRIEQLTVEWPSGKRQAFSNLKSDRLYTITEQEDDAEEVAADILSETETSSVPSRLDTSESASTLFNRSGKLVDVSHVENAYDDYARQPLLPYKLSQLGPGLAWGDVDADGKEDLYVSGAAGRAGQLFVHSAGGELAQSGRSSFKQDAASEDMAPLFFDADSDGDLDLYVVSGGIEFAVGAKALKDRLYVNRGRGIFTKAGGDALPSVGDSGSVVTACDFDRDGDLDLFVGGRSVPRRYPLVPNSRLLQNDSGRAGIRFTDVTDDVAPGLRETGLVTSALWSDVDNDGWLDLLVTHEWGPVKFWKNQSGKLIDHTESAGLAERWGWWNGIAGRDFDGDGDIDYAVTNLGLNTKYQADPESPAVLYYGDLDGTGAMRLIEARFEDGTLYPIRSRRDLARVMPFLARKYTRFDTFAAASVEEMFTAERLQQARRYTANTLESGVLINDGMGSLRFKPLPRVAQASPGFGVLLTEIDGNSFPDLYLVQNFYNPQLQTGQMDGGMSLLLRGTGDVNDPFDPVWPNRSGLIVPGDAKSVTVVDLDGDIWPDIIVGVNDSKVVAFEHVLTMDRRAFMLRLVGHPGNPRCVGSRVTVYLDDGTTQTAEVYSGGGYLSQSTRDLVFGLGTDRKIDKIEVRWPDGRTMESQPETESRILIRLGQ